MADQRFVSGPWKGALRISEPFVNSPELGRIMLDGYLPDPQYGSGFYSRPAIVDLATIADTNPAGKVQCVVSHTTDNGSRLNFVVVEGKVYRVSGASLTTFTDVTPTNVQISETARVYAVGFNDGVVFHDGTNMPWVATDLGDTPVTATPIPFTELTTALSIGSPDTTIRNTSGVALLAGLRSTYTQHDTALPAGTIPASTWGIYRVSVDETDTVTVTAGSANYTTGYASEALAIVALPACPSDEWDLGYFTVLASGSTFVAGTDALAGGASGNPATTTNYYAGNPAPWVAVGQPAIYTGALFLILNWYDDAGTQVDARTTITWSEPNLPLVGYFQTDYDNTWTLTQTGTDPINAIIGTNDALYYARAYSWGAISGAPGVNFATTATHDVVSGNVGCVASATVQPFLNYVYFADQVGRPWRFAVGGAPEPLWKQSRELFEDNPLTQANTAANAWAIIEPNLNLYLVQSVVTSATNYVPQAYDAVTGSFFGFWTVGSSTLQDAAGVLYNSTGQLVAVFGEGPAGGLDDYEVRRLTLVAEGDWDDESIGGPQWTFQTHYQGYDAETVLTPTQVTALVEVGDAAGVVALSGFVYTMNGRVAIPSQTPPSLASNVDGIGRYDWQGIPEVQGRGVRVQVAATPTSSQLKLYRIYVTARTSKAVYGDR